MPRETVAADTNVLLRYLLADEPHQYAAACDLIDTRCSPERPLAVHSIVLAELWWFFARRLKAPKEDLVAMIEALADNAHIVFQDDGVEAALAAYRRGPADFTDYLIALSSSARGAATTFTFDQDAARHPAFTLLP